MLAPGTSTRDWHDKFDLYEENGVGEYWIADPLARNLAVFVLDAATARYHLVGEYAGPGPAPRCPAWGWTGPMCSSASQKVVLNKN